MRNEEIKHIETLLKSYQVMTRTLEIRLELIKDTTPQSIYMKEVLMDKLNLYNERINILEKRLEEANLSNL